MRPSEGRQRRASIGALAVTPTMLLSLSPNGASLSRSPAAEPRQPARCRRRRSVTGAPYVRASVFRRGLSVWHERKRKEKKAELWCAYGLDRSHCRLFRLSERTRERVTKLRSKIAFHAARALRR